MERTRGFWYGYFVDGRPIVEPMAVVMPHPHGWPSGTPIPSLCGRNATLGCVRRFALAIIVSLLTFSASGVVSLVRAEPCTANEPAGRKDSACPPTCVTCGCCAQVAEAGTLVAMSWPDSPISDIVPALPELPKTDPRDILHVPKLRLA